MREDDVKAFMERYLSQPATDDDVAWLRQSMASRFEEYEQINRDLQVLEEAHLSGWPASELEQVPVEQIKQRAWKLVDSSIATAEMKVEALRNIAYTHYFRINLKTPMTFWQYFNTWANDGLGHRMVETYEHGTLSAQQLVNMYFGPALQMPPARLERGKTTVFAGQ